MRRLALLALVAAVAGCASGSGDPQGAHVTRFSLESRLVGRTLREVAVVPPGEPKRRSLLVLLHGRGSGPSTFLGKGFFAGLHRLGARAPDVLLVDGGDASYFHDRRDGRWGSMVLREAIPAAIRRLHADPRHIAIGGESMGGFGALDLARLAPGRFCAVGGHSAAVWERGGDTPQGAFDDAEDFARHDVFGASARGNPYGRTPVWLDNGDADPFLATDRDLARELRAHGARVRFHVSPGGHSHSYWDRNMPRYLRFYANALEHCRK